MFETSQFKDNNGTEKKETGKGEQIKSLQDKFREQEEWEDYAIGKANELLNLIDNGGQGIATENSNGMMRKISEALGKSRALRTAMMVGAFLMPASAFAGDLEKIKEAVAQAQSVVEHAVDSDRLKEINKQNSDVFVSKTSRIKRKPRENAHHRVLKDNFSNAEIGKVRPGSLRLHRLGEYPTNGPLEDVQRKMLKNHRETLPGITVNGESVYEIAPGVYGNKHSRYERNEDGGKINIGTVELRKE